MLLFALRYDDFLRIPLDRDCRSLTTSKMAGYYCSHLQEIRIHSSRTVVAGTVVGAVLSEPEEASGARAVSAAMTGRCR